MLLKLAWKSLLHRKMTVFLTILSITASIFVLLGVDGLKQQAKSSFTRSVSGVDVIVGPRTGQLNLLLYSVFRIGNPTNSISWYNYQQIIQDPTVTWSIPIALGDSLAGYRVIGTSEDYFKYFKYGSKKSLSFSQGRPFAGDDDVVLGAQVAKALGYALGDEVILSHGVGKTSFKKHRQHSFSVAGILESTGTPVDQSVHVSLEGLLEAHHEGGVENPHDNDQHDSIEISAFYLGLNSRISALQQVRRINQFSEEPLMAILPGVALAELWRLVETFENLLIVIGWLILASSLIGLCTMLLASTQQRIQELAILRAIGFGPFIIAGLVCVEALMMMGVGILLAAISIAITLYTMRGFVLDNYGIYLEAFRVSSVNTQLILTIILSVFLISLLPASVVYRKSLDRGLS